MNECIICYEKYNKTRKEVKCMYCDHVACSTCYESYLLTQYNGEHCMNNNCKINNSVRLWTRNFINDNFTKKFIKSALKKHQEEVILQKAKSRLPEAQQTVERMNQREKLDKEIQEINKQIAFLDLKKKQLNDQYNNTTTSNKKIQAKQFIRKCGNEQCRGFLDTKWNCGICTKNTCKECHIYKDDEENHVCKKEDVETAKMLNTECKACPTCATMIFKIDGCDQMWCTQCKTAFSWNTGIIENKIIHNPHYYEYLRKTNGFVPRNHNDNPCIQIHGLNPLMIGSERRFNPKNNKELSILYMKISLIVRSSIHIDHVEKIRFRTNNEIDYQHLCIDYLKEIITEEQFRIKLLREEKSYSKKQEIYNTLSTFYLSITDIVHRFMNTHETNLKTSTETDLIQKLTTILDEVPVLIEYINKCLDDISSVYECVTYAIFIPEDDKKPDQPVFYNIDKKKRAN